MKNGGGDGGTVPTGEVRVSRADASAPIGDASHPYRALGSMSVSARRRSIGWHRTLLALALLLLWEAAARAHWLDPDFFSPPTKVAQAMVGLATAALFQFLPH